MSIQQVAGLSLSILLIVFPYAQDTFSYVPDGIVQDAFINGLEPSALYCVDNGDVVSLARLVTAEAGYRDRDLQEAVAQLVMNRMMIFHFTLYETIHEKNVFSPVASRSYEQTKISDQAMEVAEKALSGYIYKRAGDAIYCCTVGHFDRHDGFHWNACQRGVIRVVCRIGGVVFFADN
jgi:hypothetical protein